MSLFRDGAFVTMRHAPCAMDPQAWSLDQPPLRKKARPVLLDPCPRSRRHAPGKNENENGALKMKRDPRHPDLGPPCASLSQDLYQ